MSDGPLRTRIATALADNECEDRCGTTFRQRPCPDCVERCLPQADAVIRKFDLRIERVIDGRVMWSSDIGDETRTAATSKPRDPWSMRAGGVWCPGTGGETRWTSDRGPCVHNR